MRNQKADPGKKDRKARITERDRCPSCFRGNAMTKLVVESFSNKPVGFACRHCNHQQLFIIKASK